MDYNNQHRDIKTRMVAPIFEQRRHLGCEICGHTFYGKYQRRGPCKVATIKSVDAFYPNCPKCFSPTVCGAEAARILYWAAQEDIRKRQERREARQAKRDAKPVICSRKLRFENWPTFQERLDAVSENHDLMTAHELNCDWFLDKLFWKKFGKGCHTMDCRHWSIRKRLYNGTYKSNSGKSTMGDWVPYFEITNTLTGKVHEVGKEAVVSYIELKEEYGPNRRNDPKRGWGLPNSRGYR